MSFMDLLEPEEFVGRHWHRLVGNAASYPQHPEAAVAFDDIRAALSVFFRGLGGAGGVRLTAAHKRVSNHRLSFRQRLGMMNESLDRPRFDGETLTLPNTITVFPNPDLNRDLYFWLAAYFVFADNAVTQERDPLRADLDFLARTHRAETRTLKAFPGLRARHDRLRHALLAARPVRALPEAEARVEEMVHTLLNGNAPDVAKLWSLTAPRGYRSFLPVPLWGEITARPPSKRMIDDTEEEDSPSRGAEDERKRAAERRKLDQTEREDALILNRFEKLLSFSEMVNLNRAQDEDEDEEAQKVADTMDELTLAPNKKRAPSRLKLDLDLPPDAVDGSVLLAEHTYPEWDFRKQAYHRDHCAVYVQPAPEDGEDWTPTAEQSRRIRQVRRQFEALRAKRQVHHRQTDGNEFDMDNLIRMRCDLAADGQGTDRIYTAVRNTDRDLAVALLIDVSLSSDGWIEGQRVLDVEKEALSALTQGLTACGDDHAIYSFTSRKRAFVRIEEVKGFDENNIGKIEKRISALKPGFYTRMGAAVRHTTAQLEKRPNKHRLMLVLTDGKPNDIDHYEGRYGLEDTRRAIAEARRAGITVFGVTIDHKARDYFPHLFGRGAFHIVGHIGKLPMALPKIYAHLVG